jgi:hypothetical protein
MKEDPKGKIGRLLRNADGHPEYCLVGNRDALENLQQAITKAISTPNEMVEFETDLSDHDRDVAAVVMKVGQIEETVSAKSKLIGLFVAFLFILIIIAPYGTGLIVIMKYLLGLFKGN